MLGGVSLEHADRAVLVIAHGSRDRAAVADFRTQVEQLGRSLPGIPVAHSVLEFPSDLSPSIQGAIDHLLVSGCRRLIVLPMFLFDAGHVKRDIPEELTTAQARYPELEVSLLPQLSVRDGIMDVLVDRARGLAEHPRAAGEDALLLVGAGTSSAHANAELVSVGAALAEHVRPILVEVAFVSLAHPTVAEGIARCAERGARRILTAHYFLNTGVLARRIEPYARAEAERLGVELLVGKHLGTHQAFTEALAARLRATLARNTHV